LDEWERRLAAQRRATVAVNAHSVVSDTLDYVYKHYRIQKPGEALLMQDYLYSLWQQHRIHADSILKIKYPSHREYTSLISNQLVFDYQLHAAGWNKQAYDQFYNSLQKAVAIPGASRLLLYNYLVFVITNWHLLQKEKGISAEKTYRLLKQLEKLSEDGTQLGRLKALFFVKTLPAYVKATNVKRTKEGLAEVLNYYIHDDKVISDKQQALSMDRYFVELGGIEHAFQILQAYMNNGPFDKEIFSYYLKIAFIHPFYQDKREYINLLIEAKKLLHKEEWCDLFVGPCNINFQVFDDERLRDIYCESCADRGNYAISPVK
jgi:hypothetical protein